jgi:hypothetical protein
VANGRDPGRSMDVDAGIALRCQQRLSGVKPDAYANWSSSKSVASLGRRRERLHRTRERHEESIALRIDLDAFVTREGLADDCPVVFENTNACVTELVEEFGRPFHVCDRNVTVPAGSSGIPAQ